MAVVTGRLSNRALDDTKPVFYLCDSDIGASLLLYKESLNYLKFGNN